MTDLEEIFYAFEIYEILEHPIFIYTLHTSVVTRLCAGSTPPHPSQKKTKSKNLPSPKEKIVKKKVNKFWTDGMLALTDRN
jgi:hypothetical protein